MPEALPRGEGILSELPRALHLEPGELRKRRLPDGNAAASRLNDLVLDLYVSRTIPALVHAQVLAGHLGRLCNAQQSEHCRCDIAQRSAIAQLELRIVTNNVKGHCVRAIEPIRLTCRVEHFLAATV